MQNNLIEVIGKINNSELNEISKYITKNALFFDNEKRLLSEDEIINYKEELMIEIDNIIPLIDLYDNIYLIYNIENNEFELLDISTEEVIKILDTISDYLKLLKELKR